MSNVVTSPERFRLVCVRAFEKGDEMCDKLQDPVGIRIRLAANQRAVQAAEETPSKVLHVAVDQVLSHENYIFARRPDALNLVEYVRYNLTCPTDHEGQQRHN